MIYRKAAPSMWDDDLIVDADDLTRTVWFLLLTGPQVTNLPGLMQATATSIADVLRREPSDIRRVLQWLAKSGRIELDERRRMIRVINAPRYNEPENTNVLKGWFNTWRRLPDSSLKYSHIASLRESVDTTIAHTEPEKRGAWTRVWDATFGTVSEQSRKSFGTVPEHGFGTGDDAETDAVGGDDGREAEAGWPSTGADTEVVGTIGEERHGESVSEQSQKSFGTVREQSRKQEQEQEQDPNPARAHMREGRSEPARRQRVPGGVTRTVADEVNYASGGSGHGPDDAQDYSAPKRPASDDPESLSADAAALLAELKSHSALAGIATPALARHLDETRMISATTVADALAGIRDAGVKLGAEEALTGGVMDVAKAERVATFVKNAKKFASNRGGGAHPRSSQREAPKQNGGVWEGSIAATEQFRAEVAERQKARTEARRAREAAEAAAANTDPQETPR